MKLFFIENFYAKAWRIGRSYQKWDKREEGYCSKYKEQDANGQRLKILCSVQGVENGLVKSIRPKKKWDLTEKQAAFRSKFHTL